MRSDLKKFQKSKEAETHQNISDNLVNLYNDFNQFRTNINNSIVKTDLIVKKNLAAVNLCLSLFELLKEKGIITDAEITNKAKQKAEELKALNDKNKGDSEEVQLRSEEPISINETSDGHTETE